MKAVVRSIIMSVVALIGILSFGVSAQACISTDQEFMIVYNPGITYAQAAAEVASLGNSFQLATITSYKEALYLQSLLRGQHGEFWISGNEEVGGQQQWGKKEPWHNVNHPNKEQDNFYSKIAWDHMAMSHKDRGHDWDWTSGDSHNNSGYIAGFIVERSKSADPTPTPIPPAALLLGSGMSIIGGLRMIGRKSEDC